MLNLLALLATIAFMLYFPWISAGLITFLVLVLIISTFNAAVDRGHHSDED